MEMTLVWIEKHQFFTSKTIFINYIINSMK